MRTSTIRRIVAVVMTIMVTALLVAPAAGASTVRTRGNGWHMNVSWTEYDPDDLLGLPGNVHVGFLGIWNGPWGTHSWGHVGDFDCPPGVHPWDGHHAEVAAESGQIAEAATEDAIVAIADSGATSIDGDVVVDTITEQLTEEIPADVVDEKPPACTHMLDRFLDASEVQVSINMKTNVATMTGRLIVHGGHGDHGEVGPVLGRPPINLTITGGEWSTSESSYKYQSANYSWSYWEKTDDRYGGIVSGAIGAMGFDDDADDESHGGFGTMKFNTVERIRN